MAEATCTNCGETVVFEATLATPVATVTCPACGADFEVYGAGVGGAETILVPESHAASGTPLEGTILLGSEGLAEPEVPVKIRGFLTREDVPSGDADFRLRTGTTVVGREQGAIRVDDAAVSARHFQVEERGSEFFLKDLDSSNGTFLNGHRVRSAKLRSGDRITAGGTTFAFSVRELIPM